MYHFYILRCKDGSLYCGSTNDLTNREAAHNNGRGSVYVRTHGGGRIIYSEDLPDRNSALKREAEVKKWPKQKKELLVKGSL